MSSAFKLHESVCWGTSGAIEDVLSRAVALSISMFGAEDPVSAVLIEEQSIYWSGKVVSFESNLSLERLATVLESARIEALGSGTFSDVGLVWLTGPFSAFCQQVKLAGRTT